ncbi:MAG TPA: hypothetical protein ENN67_01820, partial [Firmicutes bacterium]|nr:hypothetical protein [Bacillota bacterium]
MFISKKLSFIYSAVRGLSLLLILSLSLIFGCTGRPDTEPETELPVIPLVYLSPFIGNETEIRTPPPEPERISVREESVEGWLAPDEGVLRFPVRIMNGARLSLRLGANYDLKGQSAKAPNFTATIEYHSEIPPKPSETGETPSPVIYEFSLEQKSQCFFNWQEVDISLDNFPPGKGEIRFIADGLETDEGTIRLMWGHPTVYHPDKRRHKNILLIGVDTLRADSLSIYGGRPEVSPNLELFSQTSTTFMQARSQSSWTLPSFASMVTGHLPSTIGAVEYSGHLPQRATTLGEILRPMGYATQTICTNAWLGNRQSGFEQGMDGIWYRNDPPAQTAIHQVYEFIMRSMGRDWFCFIHLMDPHAPFNPPRAMLDQIGG